MDHKIWQTKKKLLLLPSSRVYHSIASSLARRVQDNSNSKVEIVCVCVCALTTSDPITNGHNAFSGFKLKNQKHFWDLKKVAKV